MDFGSLICVNIKYIKRPYFSWTVPPQGDVCLQKRSSSSPMRPTIHYKTKISVSEAEL